MERCEYREADKRYLSHVNLLHKRPPYDAGRVLSQVCGKCQLDVAANLAANGKNSYTERIVMSQGERDWLDWLDKSILRLDPLTRLKELA